jgi:hypothetical protein
MKILNKIDVSDWSYKHHCDNCDSDLELDKNDICYFYGGQRDGDSYFANCAVCSQRFYISESLIPKLLRLEIRIKPTAEKYYDR